ncbi:MULTISPECIES: hypothetical protein [Streptomyces]|uniref:hypothetical protein n=1 Tax=Streptomyces TaxID=1883 RepID=UPI000939A360|nr:MULTISPECIES: hypothetical protein [unclassified Streptomyces]OKJ12722.1 hypothetical protein AMK20_10170 [Streptomyces sp. TSRI0261]QNQ36728.1 hypothetical protein HYC88_25680 [Streptomyces sp. CB00271]
MPVRGSLRPHRFFGTALSLAAAVALAATLSACSGDEPPKKAYTVPPSLCGTTVDPAEVKAVLPGGDSLTTATQKPNGGTIRCNLSVDGKLVLSLAQAWWSEGHTTAAVSQAYPGTDDGKLSDDLRFVHTGTAGVGKTVPSCKASEHPEQDLYITVETRDTGIDDPDAIEKLLIAYTKAVEGTAACG